MKRLLVVTSLDVEEEGLFGGRYPRESPRVANVGQLSLLAPLSRDLGFPLTLFCAYSVFADEGAASQVLWMRENCGAEIGGHLHHWNTPPNVGAGDGPPERAATLDAALLERRLATLLQKGAEISGSPLASFRMGRWDLSARFLPLLARLGIKVDSSICPLRATKNGPDHFLAPADPYWLELPAGGRILEAPITQLPLFRFLPGLWRRLARSCRLPLDAFHFFGALSVNPFWHGEKIMRLATRLHVARGGRLINLFWHSSEMLPGASPHIPTLAARDAMLAKIQAYLAWLRQTYDPLGLTASQLASPPWGEAFPTRKLIAGQDW